MPLHRVPHGLPVYAVLAFVPLVLAGIGSARADVFSPTSDALPLLGDPYTTPGAGCFVLGGFCVESGAFTMTSVTPGEFVQSGADEFITTNATYTGVLESFPSMLPAGTVTLTGTIEQEVIGRASSTETGSWTTNLVSMALSGSLGANTLDLTLNPADTSSGTTSIVPSGSGFTVNSFFDVFAEITLEGTGLQATPGAIRATATSAPEPASLALLAGPLLALSVVRRRHAVGTSRFAAI